MAALFVLSRLVEAGTTQPLPVFMLACWFGNRPPGRSRDWRPVVRLPADFSRPGLPHTRGGSPEKCQRTWMPTLFFPIAIGMGAIFQSPQTPVGSFTQERQAHANQPATNGLPHQRKRPVSARLLFADTEILFAIFYCKMCFCQTKIRFFCNHRFSGNLAVKHPKAGERKAVKWTWNKWTVGKSLWVYAAKATLLLSFRRLPLL